MQLAMCSSSKCTAALHCSIFRRSSARGPAADTVAVLCSHMSHTTDGCQTRTSPTRREYRFRSRCCGGAGCLCRQQNVTIAAPVVWPAAKAKGARGTHLVSSKRLNRLSSDQSMTKDFAPATQRPTVETFRTIPAACFAFPTAIVSDCDKQFG